MPDREGRSVEWLRGLLLSLERLATEGVAGGAVRGAAAELRAGLPRGTDAQARALLKDAIKLLERLVHDAAASRTSPLEAWSRTVARGPLRGAVEEARRLIPDMQPTTRDLLIRLRLLLERTAAERAERTEGIRALGDRSRLIAAGALDGAMEQLAVHLPQLAVSSGEVASRVGNGIVRGAAEELGRQLRVAGRSPLVRTIAVGGAIVAVLLAVRRR
jgi:hypothetical protein